MESDVESLRGRLGRVAVLLARIAEPSLRSAGHAERGIAFRDLRPDLKPVDRAILKWLMLGVPGVGGGRPLVATFEPLRGGRDLVDTDVLVATRDGHRFYRILRTFADLSDLAEHDLELQQERED